MQRTAITLFVCSMLAGAAVAKLPTPVLSDEAKAKAAEAAAKTAHGNKDADLQLCKSMDRAALRYQADAKKAGKEPKSPTATPPCADPGPFVYVPAVAVPAPTAAAASAPGAADARG